MPQVAKGRFKTEIRYLLHSFTRYDHAQIASCEYELNAALNANWFISKHDTFFKRGHVVHSIVLTRQTWIDDDGKGESDPTITNPEAEEKNLNIVLDAIRSAAPDETDDLATANIISIPEAVPTTEPDIFVGAGDFTPTALLDETGIRFDTPGEDEDDLIADDDQATEPHPVAASKFAILTADFVSEQTVVPTFAEAMEAMKRGELDADDVKYFGNLEAANKANIVTVMDTINTNRPRFGILKATG